CRGQPAPDLSGRYVVGLEQSSHDVTGQRQRQGDAAMIVRRRPTATAALWYIDRCDQGGERVVERLGRPAPRSALGPRTERLAKDLELLGEQAASLRRRHAPLLRAPSKYLLDRRGAACSIAGPHGFGVEEEVERSEDRLG